MQSSQTNVWLFDQILVAETSKLHYEGRSFGEGNTQTDGSRYCLVMYDISRSSNLTFVHRYLIGLYDAEKETVNLYDTSSIFETLLFFSLF